MKKNANKGFSLVELIIVIAIMVVLGAVLALNLPGWVEKAREAKDITNLNTCVEAVQIYYAEEGLPTGGATVSVNDAGVFVCMNGTNNVLVDAGASGVQVTGNWTTPLQADIGTDGAIEYTGGSAYYHVENNQFVKGPASGS